MRFGKLRWASIKSDVVVNVEAVCGISDRFDQEQYISNFIIMYTSMVVY